MKVTTDRLAVAEAVLMVCEESGLPDMDAEDVRESLLDIIASVPEPAELVKYGCHCDIENTVSGEPDECVFDNGDIEDCVYATQLQREDKGKLQCKYWKPVSRPEPAEHEQPAPVATPKWCNVHQHHKWCEHNGGVMGPTGYAAPDVQAQIDAAVAREREECARVAEWVWDSGNHGAHGGEQANRTATAIRARSAKGV